MASKTDIQCYDYVNRPYGDIRTAMTDEILDIFRSATKSAASRAEQVAAGLHVNIAGVEVGKDISISIKGLDRIDEANRRKTTLHLQWEAADSPGLFPVMDAQLSCYPITSTETQLDFHGTYEPPLGILGKAIDRMVGHRIAEACVHQFLAEVADYLRTSKS